MARSRDRRDRLNPERTVVLGFVGAALLGGLVLMLPVCSASGQWTNFLDAVFTAVSAVCVTGLVVVDTGSHFSTVGRTVIALLIQCGGIGIMTLGTVILLAVGRRPSFSGEIALTDTYGRRYGNGLLVVLKYAVLFTLSSEFVGTLVLYGRLSSFPYHYDTATALGSAAFHSVSAFCNAGFSTYSDSLAAFRRDPVVLGAVGTLIVLGGLGFPVLFNLSQSAGSRFRRTREGRRLTLQTRIMLWGSLGLVLVGAAGIYLLESDGMLADLPFRDRVTGALFESITPRTAGFSTADYAAARPATLLLVSGLMFIGGGPGGTAGGVKVTTFVILLLLGTATIRGRSEVTVAGRAVPEEAVRKAIAVFMSMLLLMFAIGLALMAIEGNSLRSDIQGAGERLLFETISALGTVGLSTGITGGLGAAAKVCLMIAMLVGRLGPLTVAMLVGRRERRPRVRYPDEAIMVG